MLKLVLVVAVPLLLLFVLLYLALNMLEPSPNGWMLFRHLSLSLLFVSVIGDVYFVFSVPLFRFLCRFFCQHKNCFVSVKSLVLLSIVWFRFWGGYFFPIVFYLGSCLGSFLNVCFASFFLFSFLFFSLSLHQFIASKKTVIAQRNGGKVFVLICEMWTNWCFIFVMKCE